MCMHDKATHHYIDLIDQTTLGHRYILDEFGQKPRVGWQIDPFGHSAVQAYLLGAELGFDSLFFARIDYQDGAKRRNEKNLEVIWQGSKSLGSSSQIFTGIFPVHYEPPDGFAFEINDVSPPIQDDEFLFDYNVEERVNDFVAAALAQANVTRTNHIMWTMGTDFRYQYAVSWFRQMDKFIHYVNKAEKVVASSLALLTGSQLNSANKDSVPEFQQCPLLNISYCPPTEADFNDDEKSLIIVVYNSLGWKREEVIQIPVSSERVVVLDSAGRERWNLRSFPLPMQLCSYKTIISKHIRVSQPVARQDTGLPFQYLCHPLVSALISSHEQIRKNLVPLSRKWNI